MSKAKRQSIIIIGFGLIVLSGIFLYYALSMPKTSVSTSTISYQSSELINSTKAVTSTITQINGETVQESSNANISISYPLNLNTCTAEELMTINGIGEVKANNIIEYRDYLGGYTSVEQIKNIKGIGEGVYEKVSPYLTV